MNSLTLVLTILGEVVASILASEFLARTGWPRWLAYVFFLRVPLLLAAGILGFTYAAFLENSGSKTRETDVSAVTAARLSAAYPYVSPAARARKGGKSAQHVVDGGYYDNYGVSPLVDWLDRELKDQKTSRGFS